MRVTRSHHSTTWSSIITSTTWPSLDHTTWPQGRVSSSPSLDHSTTKSSTTISIIRLHTRLPASESSPFRTQPDTWAQGREEDSSLPLDQSLDHQGRVPFLNPSQYCVVLNIRISEYFAISSLYFTFFETSFIPQTLCSWHFLIRISLNLFSICFSFRLLSCSSCYHLAITLLLSCFHSYLRLCSLQWCLSSD